jgi:uncharacterized protein YcfJ
MYSNFRFMDNLKGVQGTVIGAGIGGIAGGLSGYNSARDNLGVKKDVSKLTKAQRLRNAIGSAVTGAAGGAVVGGTVDHFRGLAKHQANQKAATKNSEEWVSNEARVNNREREYNYRTQPQAKQPNKTNYDTSTPKGIAQKLNAEMADMKRTPRNQWTVAMKARRAEIIRQLNEINNSTSGDFKFMGEVSDFARVYKDLPFTNEYDLLMGIRKIQNRKNLGRLAAGTGAVLGATAGYASEAGGKNNNTPYDRKVRAVGGALSGALLGNAVYSVQRSRRTVKKIEDLLQPQYQAVAENAAKSREYLKDSEKWL